MRKLADRFGGAALLKQKRAIPGVRFHVDRLEQQRFLVLVLRFAPIPRPPQDGRQIDVRLRVVRIEPERFQNRSARFVIPILRQIVIRQVVLGDIIARRHIHGMLKQRPAIGPVTCLDSRKYQAHTTY